jgi:hypothetical protein
MAARAIRLLAGLALIAICGIAGYWSIRVALAERLAASKSCDDVTRALGLAPGVAEAHLRMAALLAASGQDSRPELVRAVALKPDDYRIWIRLAAESEARGDRAAAEHALLRAAESGRRFEPRWRLANFYFRRQDSEHFWRWARDVLPLAYDDAIPLFRLCREMPRADEAMERILPSEPRLLAAYLRFLGGENDLRQSEPIAWRLLAVAGQSDVPELLSYCDRSLVALRPEPALRIWNGMAGRRLIPRAPLDPERGAFLTNSSMRQPLGAGFDWHVVAPIAGITSLPIGDSGGRRIVFSGRQPESCELLTQWIPPGGGERRLRLQYRTANVGPSSSLRWTVVDAASGKELAGVSLSSDSWTWAEVRFPPRLARIVLSYRRQSGTTRIEGVLEVRGVQP